MNLSGVHALHGHGDHGSKIKRSAGSKRSDHHSRSPLQRILHWDAVWFLCVFSIAHPAKKSTTIAQKAKLYIVSFAQNHEMQEWNPAFHPAKSVCSLMTKFLQNGCISAPGGRNFAVLPHSHCKRLKYCRRASCIFASFRRKNAPPGRKIHAGRGGLQDKICENRTEL